MGARLDTCQRERKAAQECRTPRPRGIFSSGVSIRGSVVECGAAAPLLCESKGKPGFYKTVTRSIVLTLALALLVLMPSGAHAAKIGDLVQTDILEQAIDFFTFREPAVRFALLGSMLLGICCGLLGSFIVVRKMALVGDALSHAVLPGVAIGFLWNMTKDPVAIFVGATIAGLLGAAVVTLIN